MKAIDYFEKYKSIINTNEGVAELIIEMSDEIAAISKQRHSKSDETIVSIIKEINQKWNSLCGMFEKEFGQSILQRNGFFNFWKKKIPNL